MHLRFGSSGIPICRIDIVKRDVIRDRDWDSSVLMSVSTNMGLNRLMQYIYLTYTSQSR